MLAFVSFALNLPSDICINFEATHAKNFTHTIDLLGKKSHHDGGLRLDFSTPVIGVPGLMVYPSLRDLECTPFDPFLFGALSDIFSCGKPAIILYSV